MRLALFKSVKYGFTSPCGEDMDKSADWVRVTEYADVDFEPLQSSDIVEQQIATLKKEKAAVQADAQRKLTEIDRMIGNLLALPHMPTTDVEVGA